MAKAIITSSNYSEELKKIRLDESKTLEQRVKAANEFVKKNYEKCFNRAPQYQWVIEGDKLVWNSKARTRALANKAEREAAKASQPKKVSRIDALEARVDAMDSKLDAILAKLS